MATENLISEVTAEQAAKSVLAAYDSVNLIEELRAKATLSEEESETLTRNVEHIAIMLGKEWFVAALTAEQKTELEGLI